MGSDDAATAPPEGDPLLSSIAFDALFEASPVAMMITDLADGRYLHVNGAFERITGWPRDEVLGHTALEVAPWVDPDDRARMVEAVRQHGSVANRQGRFIDHDGRERAGVFSAQVIQLDGRPCLFVVANDLNEQIAEGLRASEERYRTVAELTSDFAFSLDIEPDGGYELQWITNAFTRILGYERDEVGEGNWIAYLHPDDLEMSQEGFRHSLAGESVSSEARIRAKDGTYHWLSILTHPRWDEAHERVVGLIGAARDITVEREHRHALEAAEARFRTLVERVPAVTYLWDARWKPGEAAAQYVSPQIETLLGFTLESWQSDNNTWHQQVHPDDLDAVLDEWSRAEVAGEPFRVEYRMFTKDGRELWIRDEARQIESPGEDGKPWQGVMIDITDRKRAEEALAASSERLRTLYDIAAAILAARSSSDIAREALGHIRALAGCERASVVEYRMDTEEAVWLAVDSSIETSVADGRVAPRDLWGDVSSFERGETRVVNDLNADNAWSPSTDALAAEGIRSHLTVPLVAEGVLIGTLNLGSTEAGHFTDQHLDTAQQVAGQLAIALHQARLHEQVEHYADELERRLDDLRRADEQRRQLLARVVRAQEEERQRIASDIHDDSIQKMAAVGLRLESLRRRFDEDGEAREQVDLIEETVKVSIDRLRHLMFELWPPALDRHGLADAVRTELDQTKATSGLDYSLCDELETEPLPETRTIAYRIIQEAISNIRKHAGASTVEVTLANRDGGIDVKVTDDGRGIDAAPSSPPGHLGLSAMHERADMAGGWVRINGRSGKGTTVEFWLPGGKPVPAQDGP